MSFAELDYVFSGLLGAKNCARRVLLLKSPENASKYLVAVHKAASIKSDIIQMEGTRPITETDLASDVFLGNQAGVLAFDIARFTQFLTGYTKVDYDIKPIMLHYTMIYLLDFFSRTWLTHERNRYHGLTLLDGKQETIAIEKSGGFQRAVDAFYVLNKSSLFSLDDDSGITYAIGDTQPVRIEKMKYCDAPQLTLREFVETYKKLTNIEKYSKLWKIGYQTNNANPILVSFVILHGLSSISRYRAGEWLEICSKPAFMNDYEILQHDILNVWMPDIFRETILKRNLDWSAIG